MYAQRKVEPVVFLSYALHHSYGSLFYLSRDLN